MCSGKFLYWIKSTSSTQAEYSDSPNSSKTFQLQFRGLPKAAKYKLMVEALAIDGANSNATDSKQYDPTTKLSTPTGQATMSITGFKSAHNFGQLSQYQSGATNMTNLIALFSTQNMKKNNDCILPKEAWTPSIVIDPPNAGNFKITFNGNDIKKILVGTGTNASPSVVTALGPYTICLSLEPMSQQQIEEFYPADYGC